MGLRSGALAARTSSLTSKGMAQAGVVQPIFPARLIACIVV
jgi:hypothetical protein